MVGTVRPARGEDTGAHFTLVEVLTGVDQLTIVYRNHDGTLVAETLKLGADGLVTEVDVTYGAPAATS